jgi:hypothetical protein
MQREYVFSLMRLGIIGLPSSGKTTLFNALTRSNLPTGEMSGGDRVEVHTSAVDVPDKRLVDVSKIFSPRKTTYTKVTYADIGGLTIGAGRGGLPGELVNQLEQVDGLLLVVRAFENPAVPHPHGELDPARDVRGVMAEFLLHDMVTVERRLEKLEEDRQKGGREVGEIEREQALFTRLMEVLGGGKPLREADLSPEEQQRVGGFGLLSMIPILVVCNTSDEGAPIGLVEGDDPNILIHGKIEMEIAQLPPEDEGDFLTEYGISEPGRERVIRASYDALGLLTFFTGNDEEARAWTLKQGSTCLDAADTIHSDIARGFIRAEVIAWDELVALGSLAVARAQGKLRVEGKDYIVSDGDVLYIRFNV